MLYQIISRLIHQPGACGLTDMEAVYIERNGKLVRNDSFSTNQREAP